MPSLTRIFTTGLISSILAFTALGVAFADADDDDRRDRGTNTTTTTAGRS